MPITPSPGNWNIGPINLPDWGISEAILGPQFGNSSPANNPLVQSPEVSQRLGEVKGMSSDPYGPQLPVGGQIKYALTGNAGSQPAPQPTPAPSSGGGGGGYDRMNPNANPGGAWWDAANGWTPYNNIQPQGPSQQEIDAQFNPIFDVYNQAESNLRGQLPGLISEAEAQALASKQLLGNSRMSADEQLGMQQQQTMSTKQAREGQQRQTFQELNQANRQRFGGASSAGQAASELQGREFQKNQYQIGQEAQQTIQVLNQKRQEVEREYNQGLQQLEVNKQKAINEVNRTFQDKLLEINSRRGETEAAKAQARMSALQELRNAAYQLDVSKAQFQSQLYMQAMQNSQQLDSVAQQYLSAANQGGQALSGFSSIPTKQISNVNMQSSGSTNPAFTGQIKDDELYGQIGSIQGSSETDPRFQNYQPR